MWLRGRAVGLLLAPGALEEPLADLAWHGAAAMELPHGCTDVFDAARHRKETQAAAELQQSLVAPRMARIAGGELAGSVLPAYHVSGDWFEYVENRDGAWIAIADAVGKETTAARWAASPWRALRRDDQSLEAAVRTMHEAIYNVARPEFFVTAIGGPLACRLFAPQMDQPRPPVAAPGARRRQHRAACDRAGPPTWDCGGRERRFSRRQRRLDAGGASDPALGRHHRSPHHQGPVRT